MVEKALQNVLTQFRADLEVGFIREKKRSEELLCQNHRVLAGLEDQLKAVNDNLKVARGRASQYGGESSVDGENALVSRLQNQVRDLEKQAEAAEKLRARWQRDIQTVNALRLQLKEIQRRVPQMERFDSTLGKMAQMNEILHSKAQYLTHERQWARQHLEKSEPAGGGDGCSVDMQLRGTQQPTEGVIVASVEVESTATPENDEVEDCALEEAHFFRRKVTVYSPAGQSLSPSPPPSVHQEQVRRRGAGPPRSILKPNPTSLQEAVGAQEQVARINLGQSQYNRPMVSRDSVAAASAVVEQIRTELVPSQQSHAAWSLPTVTDFKRDDLLDRVSACRKSGDWSKRSLEVTDDDDARECDKRIKLATDTCPTGSRAQAEDDAPQQET